MLDLFIPHIEELTNTIKKKKEMSVVVLTGVDKLIIAASQGNLQLIKYIIENEGVDVNSKHPSVMNIFISLFLIFYFILEWIYSNSSGLSGWHNKSH